jgi:pimeloyl-ACP methyl ester carboxylesterase
VHSSAAAGARSLTIDLDGPVHFADFGGPPDGPLVVAVHGLGGSHLNWSAVAPALTRHCRVLALDLVGHGLTPEGGRRADLGGHRGLVGDFLRAMGGTPAILMGNSMGGLVAALQAVEDPGSVAGLVLIDPALPTTRPGPVHPRVLANFVLCAVPGLGEHYLTRRRRWTTPTQSVQRVLATCCVDASRVPPDVVAAHVELIERSDRARGDAAYLRSARSLSMAMAYPAGTAAKLRRISQPALLLHGARDILVPLSAARRMGAAHPDWRFEVAPDIGHVPMLEAADWTAACIKDWLGNEGATAALGAGGPRATPRRAQLT